MVFVMSLDLHSRFVCAPDDRTQVADLLAVAYQINVLLVLRRKRSRQVADRSDHRIHFDFDWLAFLVGANDLTVMNFA